MITDKVQKILKEVREQGDSAVRKYNTQFDNNSKKRFEITQNEIKEAYASVNPQTLRALKVAARNIRSFAKAQLTQTKSFEVKTNFGSVGQQVIPLKRVGCYVPGGRYPLPSSALMSVIPAKVAGVKEIIVCSPKIASVTIVAANLAGATRIFNIGGVQAIGAMTYGTKQVPRVDKIVGPGNAYVTEAKRQVFGDVGIDFIAGPSEVLIIADETANPSLIAADLLAQAEHDIRAQATLLTTSQKIAHKVSCALAQQLAQLETKDVATQALNNGSITVVKTLAHAITLANEMAPEHLELHLHNPTRAISALKNYGSLFVGEKAAEALGDYCLGPNHILPTNRAARYTGGLSIRDFVKVVTIQKVTKTNVTLIEVAAQLAKIEGLDGHKKAAEIRINTKHRSMPD